MFLDFQQIKQEVAIEDSAAMLGLVLKRHGEQLRGKCPACESSERALVITPSKGAFYCHEAKKGGDLIALVSHIKNLGMREAAGAIAHHFKLVPASGPAASKGAKEKETPAPSQGFQPLGYLQHAHEAVQALGLAAEAAQSLGVGYAPKGLMRGRVVFPLYRQGQLVGYVGYGDDGLKLPKNLTADAAGENVAQQKQQ